MRSNQQSGPDWSSDNSDGSGIGSPFLGGPDKRPWFGPKRFGWGYGPTLRSEVLVERDRAGHADLVGRHPPLEEVRQLLNVLQLHESERVRRTV